MSVDFAKEAIRQDVGDAESWCALGENDSDRTGDGTKIPGHMFVSLFFLASDIAGNAYLSYFFTVSFMEDDLSRSVSAYQRALQLVENGGRASLPDLHFNLGMALRFQEEYDQAIEEWRRAEALDPELPARSLAASLRHHVARVTGAATRLGRAKPSRRAALCKTLARPGSRVGEGDESPRLVALSELRPGPNPGCVVALRVLAPLTHPDFPPACVPRRNQTT